MATNIASSLIGAVVGLICVAMFASILRSIEQDNPSMANRELGSLLTYVLGGGGANYLLFDFLMQSNGAVVYYMIGLSIMFLPFGLIVFIMWMRKKKE